MSLNKTFPSFLPLVLSCSTLEKDKFIENVYILYCFGSLNSVPVSTVCFGVGNVGLRPPQHSVCLVSSRTEKAIHSMAYHRKRTDWVNKRVLIVDCGAQAVGFISPLVSVNYTGKH